MNAAELAGPDLGIEEMWDGVVESTREGWAASMALGAVMPPMLMVWNRAWFVGYVQLRPVLTGDDAASGIAEMSLLAAAADATDVAVFYETQDIATACDHAPLSAGTAMNAVRAWPGGRTAFIFPYTERRLPGLAPGGLIRAAPGWRPAPQPEVNGPLEPAIDGLLDFCWTPLELPGGAPGDPEELVRSADVWLTQKGYRVRLAEPAAAPASGPGSPGGRRGRRTARRTAERNARRKDH